VPQWQAAYAAMICAGSRSHGPALPTNTMRHKHTCTHSSEHSHSRPGSCYARQTPYLTFLAGTTTVVLPAPANPKIRRHRYISEGLWNLGIFLESDQLCSLRLGHDPIHWEHHFGTDIGQKQLKAQLPQTKTEATHSCIHITLNFTLATVSWKSFTIFFI